MQLALTTDWKNRCTIEPSGRGWARYFRGKGGGGKSLLSGFISSHKSLTLLLQFYGIVIAGVQMAKCPQLIMKR